MAVELFCDTVGYPACLRALVEGRSDRTGAGQAAGVRCPDQEVSAQRTRVELYVQVGWLRPFTPVGTWGRLMSVTQRERFTDLAWSSITGLRSAVETMPFIRMLADGSLPQHAFTYYLAQDAAYLVEFSRVLSAASMLAPDPQAAAFYANSARLAREVETGLHREWLTTHCSGGSADTVDPSPVTSAYTGHLMATCLAGFYPIVAAAVLPCYRLYADIAEVIVAKAGDLTGHPYQRWILTYADPGFQFSARHAARFTDEAADSADPDTCTQMLTAFVRSSMHEYLFFNQGLTQPR